MDEESDITRQRHTRAQHSQTHLCAEFSRHPKRPATTHKKHRLTFYGARTARFLTVLQGVVLLPALRQSANSGFVVAQGLAFRAQPHKSTPPTQWPMCKTALPRPCSRRRSSRSRAPWSSSCRACCSSPDPTLLRTPLLHFAAWLLVDRVVDWVHGCKVGTWSLRALPAGCAFGVCRGSC